METAPSEDKGCCVGGSGRCCACKAGAAIALLLLGAAAGFFARGRPCCRMPGAGAAVQEPAK